MSKSEDLIKAELIIYNLRRYKNDWCLAEAEVVNSDDENVKQEKCIKIKGVMPVLKDRAHYKVTMTADDDPKWGLQYMIQSIFSAITVNENDSSGKEQFLRAIFKDSQVDCMYDALSDPFMALKNKDYAQLVRIKGCGMKTALVWAKRFSDNISKARIFQELEAFNLTNHMIDRLLDRYSSPDLVIDKVKNNPYILCTEVNGIGFRTADNIALEGGMEEYDSKRIKAYIIHYLTENGENGFSWITPDELLGAILENLSEDIPDEVITISMKELIEEKVLWHNEDKSKIGLKKYYDIEYKIATELIRLRNASTYIEYKKDWTDNLKHIEHVQGWNFTEEQIDGIKTGLENNVTVITGKAGTGKTSLVSAILDVLKGYSFVQAALAGKASARMAEVTGEEGYTIHRLLGFPCNEEGAKNRFKYHDTNPLSADIYIIDEISMIDSNLFYCLLRAIPDGAKVYLLGDPAQLESIGSGNVAYDMINSNEIPTVFLSKIHRQAAKSAIITESMKVSNGTQIIDKDWTGHNILGELQDLELTCYSDSSNTYYEIMKAFNNLMIQPDFDIMEAQIIVPIKNRGQACTYSINNAVQELYNPLSKAKREVTCFSNGKSYVLRIGDKVINMCNNYKVRPAIFNGNTGIIESFYYDEDEDDDMMLVDFIGIGEVAIPHKYWNNIELAYAISVHKSQGSQMDHVIFGLDFSAYALLTRELVYTAITRAKKHCHVISQSGALRYAVAQKGVSKKQTHLQQCLYEVAHPKIVF